MKILAHAKLNWSLDITGIRQDGYHLLDMVNQTLALSDVLEVEKTKGEISLQIENDSTLSNDQDNLIIRAAQLLKERTACTLGAHIVLQKNIPMMAGLGGGSADAAATLLALNSVWQLGLTVKQLQEIGLSLGADVPYCLVGNAKRVRGIGEKITSVPVFTTFHVVLIKPKQGLSTKEVFALCDQTPYEHTKTNLVMDALALSNLQLLKENAKNALLSAACKLCADIEPALSLLRSLKAEYTQMTGAGSTVYGVFKKEEDAKHAFLEAQKHYDHVFLTSTFTA